MVEHVYNPETAVYEKLEAATVEAAQLRRKLADLDDPEDQRVVRQQLQETEATIAALQRRLRG